MKTSAKRKTAPAVGPTLGEIGLSNFAPYLMNRVMARWNAGLADDMRTLGMTTPKMRALAILGLFPSLTVNELAVYAVTEQSTMSRSLDALEEQGLVRRISRADDMRVRDISITREGRAAFDSLWPTMYGHLKEMFAGVSDEEQRAFVAVLQKILANFEPRET